MEGEGCGFSAEGSLGSNGRLPTVPQGLGGSFSMERCCSNVYVQGLSERGVECLEDVLVLLRTGARNRAVRTTEYNFHSSRSHAILQLIVETESVVADTEGRSARDGEEVQGAGRGQGGSVKDGDYGSRWHFSEDEGGGRKRRKHRTCEDHQRYIESLEYLLTGLRGRKSMQS